MAKHKRYQSKPLNSESTKLVGGRVYYNNTALHTQKQLTIATASTSSAHACYTEKIIQQNEMFDCNYRSDSRDINHTYANVIRVIR